MILNNFEAFVGQHCETTTVGSLLKQLDINLSEAMLFGLGEGLYYIYWKMKFMETPFIGGRIKPDMITENICRNLNLQLEVLETSSLKKAWQNVAFQLDKNIPVGLKLDCYHLDYFNTKIHFAGHYVAMFGYDDQYAYLVDTEQQGGRVKTSLENLALARNEKGTMSSKNKSFTIKKKGKDFNLKQAVKMAIHNNASSFLNPPIKNMSYKGILKTSKEIMNWFDKGSACKEDFALTALLMERAGTGGALFRNLYRDFLKESAVLLAVPEIYDVYQDFTEIALKWTELAQLFDRLAKTYRLADLNQASGILVELSSLEKAAMEKLLVATN